MKMNKNMRVGLYVVLLSFFMLFYQLEIAIAQDWETNKSELYQFKMETLSEVYLQFETGPVSNKNLISLSVLCASPKLKYTKKEKRKIEEIIHSFPDTIMQKDTLSFYIQHILRLSYNEYVKKNYKEALKFINHFTNIIYKKDTCGFLNFSYSAITGAFGARDRLERKARIKRSPRKSWIDINPKQKWKNNYQTFIVDVIDDIPQDLYDTKLILAALYDEKNRSFLEITKPLFKAIEDNDVELVKHIFKYWNLPHECINKDITFCSLCALSMKFNANDCYDFLLNKVTIKEQEKTRVKCINISKALTIEEIKAFIINYLSESHFYKPSTKTTIENMLNTTLPSSIVDFMIQSSSEQEWLINHDISHNKATIETSSRIMLFLNVLYGQYNYKEICEKCILYEQYISIDDLSSFYNIWALSESYLGRYKNAILFYKKAIKHSSNKDEKNTIFMNLGFTYCELGNYKAAIQYLTLQHHKYNDDYTNFLLNDYLGYIYSFSNKKLSLNYYEFAEKYLDETTLYNEKKVRHFVNKSRVVSSMYKKRLCLERALCYINNGYSADSISLGAIYTEFGTYYNSIFQYSKADDYFKLAFKCYNKLFAFDKRKALLELNYANNLICLQKYDLAIAHLINLRNIKQQILSTSHIEYFYVTQILLKALILSKQDYKQIHQEYERLISLFPNERNTLKDIDVISLYHISKGETIKAIEVISKVLYNIYTIESINLLKRVVPIISGLPTKQREVYLSKVIEHVKKSVALTSIQLSTNERFEFSSLLDEMLDYIICNIQNETQYANLAFRFSLFTKGVLFHVSHNIKNLLTKDKETIDKSENILYLREQLNNAIANRDSILIIHMQSKIEQNERELTNESILPERLIDKLDISQSDILKCIGKNGLAVDFVQYTENDSVKYGAFIFSNRQNPTFIQICDEYEIRRYIDPRTNTINKQFYIEKKENKGYAYNLIWGKLVSYFECYDNIYFSTDGALNLLAIEYLCDSNDKQICDKYKLHRVFHLADIKKTTNIGDNIIVIGVSDHNSPIKGVQERERGKWSDLPGVNRELFTIKNKFAKNKRGAKTLFILNDDANEEFVKTLNKSSITTLHIATHGFYKDKKTLLLAAADSTHIDYNVARRTLFANKETLSGLILRRGNKTWQSPKLSNANDDILTSDEIENLTFPNLKLTVLSACETGLGEVNSEGVWGLQRAFRIAGSESLICSLCRINDKWTAKFMDIFYEYASQGYSIYESFHKARKYLFDNKKRDSRIWASMILIE